MKKIKFLSFWAINAPLDSALLKNQMDQLKSLGMDGVVFQPRYYPGCPPYLSQQYMDILSEIILHAKKTQMDFWIYDENGWPSGSADGEVLKRNPDAKIEWIEINNG